MNTSDLFTPVVTTLPQDPVQVDNPDPDQSSGATTDNWTQPVGDGEDGGTAGSVPDSHRRVGPPADGDHQRQLRQHRRYADPLRNATRELYAGRGAGQP